MPEPEGEAIPDNLIDFERESFLLRLDDEIEECRRILESDLSM